MFKSRGEQIMFLAKKELLRKKDGVKLSTTDCNEIIITNDDKTFLIHENIVTVPDQGKIREEVEISNELVCAEEVEENIVTNLSEYSVADSDFQEVEISNELVYAEEVEENVATNLSDDSVADADFQPSDTSTKNTSGESENIIIRENTKRKKRVIGASAKIERDKSCHKMRSPCRCKERCKDKISEARRIVIWNEYFKLDYNRRKAWVYSRIIQSEKKRKITKMLVSRRTRSLSFTLPDERGIPINVCKIFFLKTLGYHKKNDKFITTVLKTTPTGSITPNLDMRGSHEPVNKCNREILRQHILRYNPCVSHYRREHAPNRLYLPSDVKIKDMVQDYNEKYPDKKVSYQTYRKVAAEMNIGFTKLGHEECDTCTVHAKHIEFHERASDVDNASKRLPDESDENNKENEVLNENITITSEANDMSSIYDKSRQYAGTCQECANFVKHADKAKISRNEYRNDCQLTTNMPNLILRSVDLQKVIMLPRIPGSKKTCFTRRIVAFHQTFALMKSENSNSKKQHISVLWHEALAGRKSEEIASAYYVALKEERDAHSVIYWADNCSAQNKNWRLFTTLVTLVNSDLIAAEDITIKCFEAGHTFMSADSVHHGVEQSMKYMGNIYDFNDFVKAVDGSNSKKMKVICMENRDILAWTSGDSKSKCSKQQKQTRPLLSYISVVQFRRKSRCLYYKLSMTNENFAEFDFLKIKFKLDIPKPLRSGPRGISLEKKQAILSQLGPLMPPNRKEFWINLEETDAEDLITNFE